MDGDPDDFIEFDDFFGADDPFGDLVDGDESAASFLSANANLLSDPGIMDQARSPQTPISFGSASFSSRGPIKFSTVPAPMIAKPVFQRTERQPMQFLDVFEVHRKSRKVVPWESPTISASRTDPLFYQHCLDPNAIIYPRRLGFDPAFFWPDRPFTFGDIVYDFFRKRNNQNARFHHKLFNALCLANESPVYAELVGVQALTTSIIKVNKGAFARLLGVKTVEGSLFHSQGNFPQNHFRELNAQEAQEMLAGVDISDVDFDDIRLLIYTPGPFFTIAAMIPQIS